MGSASRVAPVHPVRIRYGYAYTDPRCCISIEYEEVEPSDIERAARSWANNYAQRGTYKKDE